MGGFETFIFQNFPPEGSVKIRGLGLRQVDRRTWRFFFISNIFAYKYHQHLNDRLQKDQKSEEENNCKKKGKEETEDEDPLFMSVLSLHPSIVDMGSEELFFPSPLDLY
jgi:hypothetical protein